MKIEVKQAQNLWHLSSRLVRWLALFMLLACALLGSGCSKRVVDLSSREPRTKRIAVRT